MNSKTSTEILIHRIDKATKEFVSENIKNPTEKDSEMIKCAIMVGATIEAQLLAETVCQEKNSWWKKLF